MIKGAQELLYIIIHVLENIQTFLVSFLVVCRGLFPGFPHTPPPHQMVGEQHGCGRALATLQLQVQLLQVARVARGGGRHAEARAAAVRRQGRWCRARQSVHGLLGLGVRVAVWSGVRGGAAVPRRLLQVARLVPDPGARHGVQRVAGAPRHLGDVVSELGQVHRPAE